MQIQILGGKRCSPCAAMDRLVRRAVNELGIDATIEKVTDERAIIAAGVMSIPTLVVDGRVLVSGRVPSRIELATMLAPSTPQ